MLAERWDASGNTRGHGAQGAGEKILIQAGAVAAELVDGFFRPGPALLAVQGRLPCIPKARKSLWLACSATAPDRGVP